ncbi:hypothetical protein ACIRRA_05790 [Nocardia sp. NPDC101769]|uniref:hypothetical protein n=1 Tax=Nocardia sp. NPDC101769 TaxID=3364333 RepID=UPI0037F83F5C
MTDTTTRQGPAETLAELLGELPPAVAALPEQWSTDLAECINSAIVRETALLRDARQAALQKLPMLIRVAIERLVEE